MPKIYITRHKAAKWLNVAQPTVDKIALANGVQRHQVPGHRRIYYRADQIQRLVDLGGMQSDADGSTVSP